MHRGVSGKNSAAWGMLYAITSKALQELSKLSSALAGKDNSRLNDLGMMTGEWLFT